MDDGSDLIGVPFRYGARGPDAFDCYGLVMEMARRHDVSIPDFGFAEEQGGNAAIVGVSLPQWKEVAQTPGAIVLIRVGRFVAHVGYLITPNTMIHSWEMSGGVTLQRVDEWQHRIVGFYKYVGY